jgi:UDP-N-acetylglucosamine acyltransferase
VIHPAAIVSPSADVGEGVEIGPFAVIEDGVVLGAGTRIEAHAMVRRGSSLGVNNVVHPFAVLGGEPQDRRHAGEATSLTIGDGNVFREHVTVHKGTEHGGGVTRIGSHGLFMVSAHVAHDAQIGDAVILANATLLGGHVTLGDRVVTGGGVALAPFVRVGERAFLAGGAMVERDVPPFVIAAGDRARVRALNKVGLRRSGVPETSIARLEAAFVAIFRKGPRAVAAALLGDDEDAFVRALATAVLAAPSR